MIQGDEVDERIQEFEKKDPVLAKLVTAYRDPIYKNVRAITNLIRQYKMKSRDACIEAKSFEDYNKWMDMLDTRFVRRIFIWYQPKERHEHNSILLKEQQCTNGPRPRMVCATPKEKEKDHERDRKQKFIKQVMGPESTNKLVHFYESNTPPELNMLARRHYLPTEENARILVKALEKYSNVDINLCVRVMEVSHLEQWCNLCKKYPLLTSLFVYCRPMRDDMCTKALAMLT